MKNALDRLNEESQKEFWASLALRHCPKMTQRLMRSLLVQYGSAYKVFCEATNKNTLVHSFLLTSENTNSFSSRKSLPKDLCALLKQETWRASALLEWREAKAFEGEIILWTDYRYPLELKQLIDAPAFFYIKGDISLLSSVCVGIVGSRKCNTKTLLKAGEIAEELSHSGVCVVSGMAKGIDYASHKGALKGIGKTIAVLGCGADIIYPRENREIYYEILNSGLIISEFSPRTKPLAHNFPIRNRIVSGLCAAVVVAEAAPRSGSLITARIALEQNRPVYAFKPLNERHSLGTQNLISDGAVQIEDAMAILVDIAPHLQNKVSEQVTHKPLATTIDLTLTSEILPLNSLATDTKSSINNTQELKKESKKKRKNKENTIHTREYLKNIPTKNADVTEIAIDFVSFTKELMGEQKDVSASEILKPRKRKKIGEKSIEKSNVQSSEKNNTKHINQNKKLNCLQEMKSLDISQLDIYEQEIIGILKNKNPLSPDDILLYMHNSNISQLTTALLMLEVESYVERLSGNRYTLK